MIMQMFDQHHWTAHSKITQNDNETVNIDRSTYANIAQSLFDAMEFGRSGSIKKIYHFWRTNSASDVVTEKRPLQVGTSGKRGGEDTLWTHWHILCTPGI